MQGRDLSTTSCAVLGLLLGGPQSGYGLADIVGKSLARFWPIEKSQVYVELARLEQSGYIEGRHVAQDRFPDKRVFELTDAGRARFEDWLSKPGLPRERRRSPFLVKLFFGAHLTADDLSELLAAHRSVAEAERVSLEAVVEHLSDRSEARFGRATAAYGLRRAEATIAWCDDLVSELAGEASGQGSGRDAG